MQPAAARWDRRVARGGLAYSLGVDGEFDWMCTICHVRGSDTVYMLVAPRQVNAWIRRVYIDVQMTCSSSAVARALPPRQASKNSELHTYEG